MPLPQVSQFDPGLLRGRPTRETYASRDDYYETRQEVYYPSDDEQETMKDVSSRMKILLDELWELHGVWYQLSLFKHGLQYTFYDYDAGFPIYNPDLADGTVNAIYNVMQAVQLQSMSYFLESPPRYKVASVTEDGINVEKSKAGTQIAEHFERHTRLKTKRSQVANWNTSIGNAAVFVGWDPKGGEMWEGVDENGNLISMPTGDWMFEVVPPYQTIPDPEARHWTELKWVIRQRRVYRDWVVQHYPDKAKYVDDNYHGSDLQANFEQAWMTLSSRHGFTGRTVGWMPPGRGVIHLYEMWELPSPHYPKGRYVIMTSDEVCLHVGPNPYGKFLPFVFWKYLDVEGSFWGRSPLMDVMHLQVEINRRESQKSEHCNLLGNPPLFHYRGSGLDEDKLSNLCGSIVELNPMSQYAPPFFLKMPELSMTVREMVPEAMRFVDFVSGHFGPSRGEVMSQVKSGVQQMMLEEADSRNMKPLMEDWEAGWEQVFRLAIRSFHRFARLKRKIKVLGEHGQWRIRMLSGSDIDDDTDVEVVAGSTLPTSDSTVFTKMLSLLQAGAFNLEDPTDNQRFWEALKMGDMVRFVSDKKGDREKALRELDLIRQGRRAYVDPIADDPDIHLDVINSFIRSPEWENASDLVKAMALMHRTEHLQPLMASLQRPSTADPGAFPMFPPAEGGGMAMPQSPIGGMEVGTTSPVAQGGPGVGPGASSRGGVNLGNSP